MGDIQKLREDGTWEEPVDLERHKEFVEVEGMRVPILSLESEHQAYVKLGRIERAAMLKEWCQNTTIAGPTRPSPPAASSPSNQFRSEEPGV